jgi:hypothetical protein
MSCQGIQPTVPGRARSPILFKKFCLVESMKLRIVPQICERELENRLLKEAAKIISLGPLNNLADS